MGVHEGTTEYTPSLLAQVGMEVGGLGKVELVGKEEEEGSSGLFWGEGGDRASPCMFKERYGEGGGRAGGEGRNRSGGGRKER